MQETVQEIDGRNRGEDQGDIGSIEKQKNIDEIQKMYDSVCEFCFRYLGFISFEQVDRMTIPEYMLLVKVHIDIEEEKEYDRHWRSFLNMAAQATVKSGKRQKMKYPTFKKFYNRDEILRRIHNEPNEMDEITARTIDFRKRKGGSR